MEINLHSGSLENTVQKAASILDAELVVADRLLFPVAYTDNAVPDAVWEDLMHLKLVPSLGWVSNLAREPILMEYGRSKMYEWHDEIGQFHRLFVDIERNQRKMGYLSVVAHKEGRDQDFVDLVMILAGVIAVQFETKTGHIAENSVFEHYVTALLEDSFNSEDAQDLLVDTGLRANGFFSLLVVDISRYDNTRHSLHSFRVAVERASHVTRSTLYGNRLVLLLTAQNENAARTRDYSLLEEVLSEYGSYAAVSRTFTSLWTMKDFYTGANKILKHSFCAPPNTRILSAENMGISFVVDALLRIERPEDLVDPRVRKLLAYDKKNGTEYVKTLFTVLRYSRRVSLTCEKMHIHRNTLDYRLQRIAEITDIDWSDGDMCFRIYLSLNALKYLERRQDCADQWD